jgi:asparagine synthase (glutamine-hydrolysing)
VLDCERTLTDAAMLAGAYRRWGEDFLQQILGDFAFALWDRRNRRLLCARDQLGVAAFYYFSDAHVLVCGSELGQILVHPRVDPAPNEPMIAEVLTMSQQDAEDTVYQGIYRLPGSFMLAASSKGVNKRRYYDLDPSCAIRYRSDDEYGEHFRALFDDAVRKRLRSHRGVNADLSGGLDSSSVVVAAREQLDSGAAACESFEVMSVTFDDPRANESSYIAAVESATRLHSIRVHEKLLSYGEYLRQVRDTRDLPDMPNMAMCDVDALLAIYDKARVWLTGIGGDDFLTGSEHIYADLIRGGRFGAILRRLRLSYARYALDRSLQHPLITLFKGGPLTLVPPRIRRALKPYFKKPPEVPVLTVEFARRTKILERMERREPVPRCRDFAQGDVYSIFAYGGRTYVLEMIDRFGARCGVEPRHPFFDRRLVEFIFAIPEEQRTRGDLTKFVLRSAMKSTLPPLVLHRRDKAEFGHHFPETLSAMGGESLFDSLSIASTGWVDGELIRNEYRTMRALYDSGNPAYAIHIAHLWHVVAVEMWFNAMFAGKEQEPRKFDSLAI